MKLSSAAQKFLDSMIEKVEDGDTFLDVVGRAVGEVEDVKDLGDMRSAIKQLETKVAEDHTKEIKDLRLRVERAEKRAYNGVNQYRGAFPSEDAARTFGLTMIGRFATNSETRDWAQDVLKTDHKTLHDGLAKNRVFTTTTADAVIPEIWLTTMEDLLDTHGVFERDALSVPMTSDLVHWSKKTGRVSAVPMAEGGSLASSQPTIDGRELTARKWGAYTEVNNEAAEDAIIAIAEFIAADMAEAHALAVDEAGFLGDGSGTYNQITGVLNALGAGAIVNAGDNAWGGYTYEALTAGIGKCTVKTFSGIGQPKWYCSHTFYWTVLAPLQLAAGGNTIADIGRGPVPMFAGFPVQYTQVLPQTAAGTQIPLIFGNLRRGAAFGDRRRLTFKASDHFKFANDQTAMLSTRRYDIDVHGGGDGSNAETLVGFRTAA
ncbi:phage major capsid protein [Algisphaera agarilytica]|uniref:HK97 family phage major capsid protein n=1 Tax=Algisphaera agarilytica TaxID=1385975 RepID=A0A7X0H6V8_9BACT|nr:phage major capsid protein [Algisphaera agarilytica]MBB6429216.1 HK97 family phage major capsid protein [Algisphaera agarilytica]